MRTIPFTALGVARFASAQGGKVVVQAGPTVLRYTSEGELDRGFAENGKLRIGSSAGTRFTPEGLAVDSRGRVVVSGRTTPSPSKPMFCGTPGFGGETIPTSSATVLRFNRNGDPDRTFGQAGVVSTDFGFPPPTTANGRLNCEAPVVHATGLAVDSADRPIVTGGAAREITMCKASGPFTTRDQPFVARLEPDGDPDPAFSGSGVRSLDPALLGVRGPIVGPRDGMLYLGGAGEPCDYGTAGEAALGGLDTEGLPRLSFGPNGWMGLGPEEVESDGSKLVDAMALDPAGRIVLAWQRERPGNVLAMRLRPDGSTDVGFGKRGTAILPIGVKTRIGAIAADPRGRVLLAGSHTRRSCDRGCRQGGGPVSVFASLRLHSDGSWDRRFGRRPVVFTGFGSDSTASATQILFDRGRILLGGTVEKEPLGSRPRFALIRYLSRD